MKNTYDMYDRPKGMNKEGSKIGTLKVKASHTWFTMIAVLWLWATIFWFLYKGLLFITPDFLIHEKQYAVKIWANTYIVEPVANAGVSPLIKDTVHKAVSFLIYPNGENNDVINQQSKDNSSASE